MRHRNIDHGGHGRPWGQTGGPGGQPPPPNLATQARPPPVLRAPYPSPDPVAATTQTFRRQRRASRSRHRHHGHRPAPNPDDIHFDLLSFDEVQGESIQRIGGSAVDLLGPDDDEDDNDSCNATSSTARPVPSFTATTALRDAHTASAGVEVTQSSWTASTIERVKQLAAAQQTQNGRPRASPPTASLLPHLVDSDPWIVAGLPTFVPSGPVTAYTLPPAPQGRPFKGTNAHTNGWGHEDHEHRRDQNRPLTVTHTGANDNSPLWFLTDDVWILMDQVPPPSRSQAHTPVSDGSSRKGKGAGSKYRRPGQAKLDQRDEPGGLREAMEALRAAKAKGAAVDVQQPRPVRRSKGGDVGKTLPTRHHHHHQQQQQQQLAHRAQTQEQTPYSAPRKASPSSAKSKSKSTSKSTISATSPEFFPVRLPPMNSAGAGLLNGKSHVHVHDDGTDGSATFNPGSAYHEYTSGRCPRLDMPARLLHNGDKLERTILEDWCLAEPSSVQKRYTSVILQRLTSELNRVLRSGSRFEVDVFGSMSWGGATGKGGDLDLVVIDKNMPLCYQPNLWTASEDTASSAGSSRSGPNRRRPAAKLKGVPQVYSMYWLSNFLSNTPGFGDVKPIVHATTPIVKFKAVAGGLDCDINVNDLGGWYNSALILAYCKVSPFVFRPMIHAMKKWLSANNLNDASGASGPPSMSSYCLTLMVIGYLQHIGELPNLQEGVEAPVPFYHEDEHHANVIWVGYGRPKGQAAHIWFRTTPPAGWTRRDSNLTAADAIRSFFSFFSRDGPGGPRFDMRTQLVSVLNGGIIARSQPQGDSARRRNEYRREINAQGLSKEAMVALMKAFNAENDPKVSHMGTGAGNIQPGEWEDKHLVVQDPFIWEKNCAASMSKEAMEKLFKAIKGTQLLLTRDRGAGLSDFLVPH